MADCKKGKLLLPYVKNDITHWNKKWEKIDFTQSYIQHLVVSGVIMSHNFNHTFHHNNITA